MEANSGTRGLGNYLFLFFVSFLSLFLEVLLIRWIGTEIRIFAFFRNLVLISCFLGLGVGFSLKKFKTGLLASVILVLVLTALVHPAAQIFGVSVRKIPEYLIFPDLNIWFSADKTTTLLKLTGGFAMVAVLMTILAGIFMPFGQILGQIFDRSDNRIRDYSINLLGSLIGTWAFALMSYLDAPPWVWFLAAGAIAVFCIRPMNWRTIAAMGLLIPILFLSIPKERAQTEVYWSPYQKLTAISSTAHRIPYITVAVNSVLYMYILDLSYDQADRFPGFFNREQAPYYPYDLPFRFKPRPNKVLIVGAGAGNDAAGAIRNGAGEIDAVEIDPVIARLGLMLHPEKPYQNPKVNLIIDDARSYFKKSKKKYDLIIFGLLDSHTLTSNFTNINLDSYVYTLESFQEARDHLAPGGIMMINFQTAKAWLGYKLFSWVTKVFSNPPMMLYNYGPNTINGIGGTLFICGDPGQLIKALNADPGLLIKFGSHGIPTLKYTAQMGGAEFDIPTDDWPYLYLQKRKIPTPHLVMIGIILVLMLAAIRFLFPAGKTGPGHFLFLGAGFMLVEVHSISKIALLFGSTWVVNVVIISAILVMILCANLLVLKFKIERPRYWYAGLFISLALAYLIPVQSFFFLPGYLARGLLVGAFYSLPLFFAGVIFASSIKKVAGVEAAFASNMLGSAIGGMLESLSFLFGVKAVVLIAILLYLASAITLRKMPVMK